MLKSLGLGWALGCPAEGTLPAPLEDPGDPWLRQGPGTLPDSAPQRGLPRLWPLSGLWKIRLCFPTGPLALEVQTGFYPTLLIFEV